MREEKPDPRIALCDALLRALGWEIDADAPEFAKRVEPVSPGAEERHSVLRAFGYDTTPDRTRDIPQRVWEQAEDIRRAHERAAQERDAWQAHAAALLGAIDQQRAADLAMASARKAIEDEQPRRCC